MDGGGGITAQPHTILGPVLWGAGAAWTGAGSTSLVGTPCCTDPSGEEGHAGKVEQGGWMWLQPGTGLSWKVNKPMRIAAMPITAPSPRMPDRQQRPRTTTAQCPPRGARTSRGSDGAQVHPRKGYLPKNELKHRLPTAEAQAALSLVTTRLSCHSIFLSFPRNYKGFGHFPAIFKLHQLNSQAQLLDEKWCLQVPFPFWRHLGNIQAPPNTVSHPFVSWPFTIAWSTSDFCETRNDIPCQRNTGSRRQGWPMPAPFSNTLQGMCLPWHWQGAQQHEKCFCLGSQLS